MGINKVIYNGGTLIDLTGTTATADKILTGYGAYGKDGVWMDGTATSGSGGSVTQDQDGFIVLPPDGGSTPSVGGLEYETGTWTPSEDIDVPTINFENTHTTRPFAVTITDIGDTMSEDNSMVACLIISYYDAFGKGVFFGGTSFGYGRVQYTAQGSSSGASSAGGYNISYLTGTSNSSMSSWLSSSSFSPHGSSKYWRAGRTYKWIAVWAPTT